MYSNINSISGTSELVNGSRSNYEMKTWFHWIYCHFIILGNPDFSCSSLNSLKMICEKQIQINTSIWPYAQTIVIIPLKIKLGLICYVKITY